jgi:hypothetical protein
VLHGRDSQDLRVGIADAPLLWLPGYEVFSLLVLLTDSWPLPSEVLRVDKASAPLPTSLIYLVVAARVRCTVPGTTRLIAPSCGRLELRVLCRCPLDNPAEDLTRSPALALTASVVLLWRRNQREGAWVCSLTATVRVVAPAVEPQLVCAALPTLALELAGSHVHLPAVRRRISREGRAPSASTRLALGHRHPSGATSA